MRTLIVHVPADAARETAWALFDAPAGGAAAAPLREGAAAPGVPLALDPPPDRTWAVVPGAAVTVHAVDLPPDASPRHALAGAAFALEDALAADPDDLHFALGLPGTDKRLVAVADHAAMAAWTARLAGHGLMADLLVPDFLAMPDGAAVLDGVVLARTADGGFAAEAGLAPWVLETDAADLPAVSGRDFRAGAYAALLPGPAINLLQGRYAPRRDWGAALKPWRRAGALAAGVAAALLGSVAVEGVRLNRQAEAAAVQAEAVFRRALPEVTRVVNPRAQMRAYVQGVRGGADGFLALSEVVVGAAAAVEDAEVTSLRFDGRRAEMAATLSLASFDGLERLKTELTRRGGVVQEGGARQDGARILTDVTVRLP